MELFLIILLLLESFSIISQSLTLSNRLSINILAGSLLISSLSVAVIIFSIYLIINVILIILLLIIYSFEILNSFVQLFIFNLLSIEYISTYRMERSEVKRNEENWTFSTLSIIQ